VLCLIGGMDRGLRVGGRCCSKLTLKHGTLLGVLKPGSTSAKVLWDDSDALIRSVGNDTVFCKILYLLTLILLVFVKMF